MKGGGGKHITTISNFRLPFTPNRPAVKALKKKSVNEMNILWRWKCVNIAYLSGLRLSLSYIFHKFPYLYSLPELLYSY